MFRPLCCGGADFGLKNGLGPGAHAASPPGAEAMPLAVQTLSVVAKRRVEATQGGPESVDAWVVGRSMSCRPPGSLPRASGLPGFQPSK